LGADGNDTLDGGASDDDLRGEAGRPSLCKAGKTNFLAGGNDTPSTLGPADFLGGDLGNDRLTGGGVLIDFLCLPR